MIPYAEFTAYVQQHGRRTHAYPSPGGVKEIYDLRGLQVVLDTAPVQPEDLVVAVIRGGEILYLSPAGCRGAALLTGDRATWPSPDVLRELLNLWKNEV
ncbi:MAG: hypothetical protein WC343_01965 [Bacilli bacterium]|jgi:hypothetical protein